MSRADRREDEVRRMLDRPPRPAVPPRLAALAAERGHRILRRRRAARTLGWWLLLTGVVAFAVWAAIVEPWHAAPVDTTPHVEGW
ncbi:hypothetical protein [Streptomyces palmae]|uniref:hypothetical protein n=1 Tax=Streptomyces palmae TaxID=1701085 RepID=UPI001ADFAB36|nr:hypothetical protein [Streptomyces palmae]